MLMAPVSLPGQGVQGPGGASLSCSGSHRQSAGGIQGDGSQWHELCPQAAVEGALAEASEALPASALGGR